jgi:hypothetical protein
VTTAEHLFRKLKDVLESVGVPYMITGSFASAIHGVPRSTHDVDVVIAPTSGQLETLVTEFLRAGYYADLDDAIDSSRRQSQFNVIDPTGAWKVDFIFRRDRPFSRTEFERRQRLEILGVSLFAVRPEDLLVAKLEWAKLGESERQLRDAAGIISIQGQSLDRAYVEHWVAELGLAVQWKAALAAAGLTGHDP